MAYALPVAVLVVLVLAWETLASGGQNLLIPTFSETMRAFVRMTVVTGELWPALFVSNQAAVIGFAISVAIGIPLGVMTGRLKRLDRVLSPYWAILLAMPIAPLIPVAITALGLTLAARVVLVVMFTAVYLIVTTRAGVRAVDPALTEMARSYQASELQIWRSIVLPAASPAIFAGLRIGVGRAVAGMVLAEILLVAVGIGRLMLLYRGRFQADMLFAIVIAVILEALILLTAMGWLQKRFAPWSD
jgi:NitT/TauT family transport system permease protein